MAQAARGIAELNGVCRHHYRYPQRELLAVAEDAGFFFESFRIADDILRQGVQGNFFFFFVPNHYDIPASSTRLRYVKTIMSRMVYAVMARLRHRARNARLKRRSGDRVLRFWKPEPIVRPWNPDHHSGSTSLKLAGIAHALLVSFRVPPTRCEYHLRRSYLRDR